MPLDEQRARRIRRWSIGIMGLCILGILMVAGFWWTSRVNGMIADLRDADLYVRRKAVGELGETGDSRAVEPLIAALKDPSEKVRSAAAEALGKIKDPRAAEALLARARERDLTVIAGAYLWFIQKGEPGSEALLIQALDARGGEEMAEAFLNSGNRELKAAAGKWGHAHGYQVVPSYGGHVGWGSGR